MRKTLRKFNFAETFAAVFTEMCKRKVMNSNELTWTLKCERNIKTVFLRQERQETVTTR